MPKHPTQIALELWRQESRAGKSVATQLRHFADTLERGDNTQETIKEIRNLASVIIDVHNCLESGQGDGLLSHTTNEIRSREKPVG